jgi:hypothetical protein
MKGDQMSQLLANLFRNVLDAGYLPLLLAVALVGALGPALLRARGARLLWLSTLGVWLAVALAVWLVAPAKADTLSLVAVCLVLVAAVATLLSKFHWPLAVQCLVGFLIALALPFAVGYTELYFAMRFGPAPP